MGPPRLQLPLLRKVAALALVGVATVAMGGLSVYVSLRPDAPPRPLLVPISPDEPEPLPAAPPLPPPPFEIGALVPPPSHVGDVDLRKQPASFLAHQARLAANQRDWERAWQLQHWAVAAGDAGKYSLACYHGRTRRVDGAIHWLERAAIEEGADADWVANDSDLEAVRADARWPKLQAFLAQASAHWRQSGIKETRLVMPKGAPRDKPLPVVVGLHGFGSGPADFASDGFQAAANALGVAFVAVSGTVPLGPHRFRWAESAALDDARIDEALAELKDRLTVADGQVVLIGFSQGAQMSADLAARRPGRYAGAIAMSPGTLGDLGLDDVQKTAEHAKRRFVVVVGAGEHPATVARAQLDATELRALGAVVFHKAYAGMNEHSFPPDFDAALPVWVRFVLGSGPSPK